MTVSPQQFGEMVSDVKSIKKDLSEVEADIKALKRTVDGLIGRFDRIDGGWKMLMFIGGIAGTVGSGITALAIKLWPLLFGTLPKI